jgi:hypothetical protein
VPLAHPDITFGHHSIVTRWLAVDGATSFAWPAGDGLYVGVVGAVDHYDIADIGGLGFAADKAEMLGNGLVRMPAFVDAKGTTTDIYFRHDTKAKTLTFDCIRREEEKPEKMKKRV